MATGNFDLSDFLGSTLSLGSQYLQGQNTVDTAKLQQQIAAQKAAEASQSSATLKNVIIWGSVAITGIFVVVFLIKKFK